MKLDITEICCIGVVIAGCTVIMLLMNLRMP